MALRTNSRHLRLAAIPIGVVVATFIGAPTASHAQPGLSAASTSASAPTDDEPATAAVDAAAARLRALADDGSDRFGGLVVNPASQSVTIYLRGGASAASDVSALAKSLTASGTDVQVKTAAYGIDSLHRARQQVIDDPGFTKAGINSIMPATDGSALLVGATDPSHAQQLRAIAHSPVRVEVNQEGPAEPLSRWKDTSPFWGGSAVKIPTGGHCSTAFGMHYTTQSLHVLLTAAHCSPTGWNAGQYQNGLGNYNIGPNYAFDTGEDAMVINVNYYSGWTSGTGLYTGGVDHSGAGTGETFRTVTGYSINNNGDPARTSGAYSGERSNITIANNDAFWWITYPQDGVTREVFGILIKSTASPAVNVAGEGDSGGPVYSNSGSSNATARGLISSGRNGYTVACTGYDAANRTCYSQVYAPDIYDVMQFLHIALN